jgi:hypothetical protein
MADALGRRKTFTIIACCQVIAVAIYTLAPINLGELTRTGPLLPAVAAPDLLQQLGAIVE